MAAGFNPVGVGRLLGVLNQKGSGPMTSSGVVKLRHHRWGPCQLVRVEATAWIVRVESSGVLFRVRSEERSQYEIVPETPPPVVDVSPPIEVVIPTSTSARTARRAIESLRVGLPSLDGSTRQLAIGFRETESLIQRFLRDIDVDGGGAMVLKGAYGQGKTFALTVLEEIARECGFITTRIEIDATENRLSKPHHICRDLMRNLRLPKDEGSGTQCLATRTVDLLAKKCPRNATTCEKQLIDQLVAAAREKWLNDQLDCEPLAWLLSDPDILRKPHLLGILACDPNYPVAWARTYHVNPPQPKRWPAIMYGTQGDFASYLLSGVGRLARLLGYRGFLIILDEMEKWSELNWLEQSRAGNLLGGLIWGATAEEGHRGWNDHPGLLEHSRWCGGYPFTTARKAHIGVAIAMTPRGEADPEGIWCQYGTILIGDVPRFTNEELIAYSLAVVPLFAKAYGIPLPSTGERDEIAKDALRIWRRHGDMTTRSGVQAVIAAFDNWRDRKCYHAPQNVVLPVEREFAAGQVGVASDESASHAKEANVSQIKRYRRACGYYTGNGREFCVTKGSEASEHTSQSFDSIPYVSQLRKKLVETGVLAKEGEGGPYIFTRDYVFNSSSAAACIVDGNSRSGPAVWTSRR